jgi:hypothetical protein
MSQDVKADSSTSKNHSFSGEAGVPAGQAAGVTVRANAVLTFQRSVQNHSEFDKLETWLIMPTRSYIEDTLEDNDVATHVKRVKGWLDSWTMYMISGLVIARGGAKTEKKLENNKKTGVGGAV